ncbi:DUF2993 domain-containing protein [Oculatella sp. LEGE 06141]|uniref:LmeA family phospholipid-binding protein n=1 Tax=Oculatella sp. LEGE 06141 TaxID=1828648 RepID=UPI001A05E131|nr:DUF2993 domain-containing protein [Oculatella sp. LEGE 06141]MBE9179663.1 DUF2993 domain-containing protein [Oculatella sp. LEGE 06141]
MQQETTGIGDTILSNLLKMGLASQLEGADDLQVVVNGDLLQLLTGKTDSVTLEGERLSTSQDLSMSELKVRVDRLAIDLLSAATGKLELTESADVAVKVTLTEADLNQTMNAEVVRDRLQHLPLPVDERTLPLSMQHVTCYLPGDGRFILKVTMLAHRPESVQPIEMELAMRFWNGGQTIIFESSRYDDPNKALLLRETAALAMKMSEFIQLRSFHFKDVSVQIQQIEVDDNRFVLWLKADLRQIPELADLS